MAIAVGVGYDALVPPRQRDPDVSKAFGRALAAVRRRRSLTQGELEAAVGLANGSVGRFERGEREPGVGMAVRLARGLGVRPGVLMDETERELAAEEGGG